VQGPSFFVPRPAKNKKLIVISSLAITALIFASPVYAQSADVTKIRTFIKSIIQILVTIEGLVSAGFFVWGGFGYMTSSRIVIPLSIMVAPKPLRVLPITKSLILSNISTNYMAIVKFHP